MILNTHLTKEARALYTKALNHGDLIKPANCSVCNAGGKIHGHHADYAKPLDVEWLCNSCHQQRHKDRVLSKSALKRMANGGRKCRGVLKRKAGRKGFRTMVENIRKAIQLRGAAAVLAEFKAKDAARAQEQA